MNPVATVTWFRDILARGGGFDLDHDGAKEFVMRRGGTATALVDIHESTGNDSFALAHSLDLSQGFTNLPFAIPLDAGDADGDGLGELVVFGRTNGRHLRVYEATSANTYPTAQHVWQSPGWGGIITGGRIADTDRDGRREIVFGGLAPGFVEYAVAVFENTGDNSYVQKHYRTVLTEPQALEVMKDLDGDGRDEILYASPGEFAVLEAGGDDMYQQTSTGQLLYDDGDLVNAEVLVDGGDLDGDGKKEFLVGGLKTISHPSDPFIYVLFLFEAVADNDFQVVATFTGPFDAKSASSAAIADVDGDGDREIVIAVVDVTIYKSAGNDSWKPIWTGNNLHQPNWMLGAGDHDQDGKEEILFRQLDDSTGIYEIDPADAVDQDADGRVDAIDNCPALANPGQEDADADNVGNVCDNCVHGPNPTQGPAPLGQNVVALDTWTFGWAAQADVVYVRGPLALVGSYTTNVVQSLPLATSFADSSAPAGGSGFYYLVRPDCPVGSWQTVPGAEPGRDAALP